MIYIELSQGQAPWTGLEENYPIPEKRVFFTEEGEWKGYYLEGNPLIARIGNQFTSRFCIICSEDRKKYENWPNIECDKCALSCKACTATANDYFLKNLPSKILYPAQSGLTLQQIEATRITPIIPRFFSLER